MNKEDVGRLFLDKNLNEWNKLLGSSIKNLSRYRNSTRPIPLNIFIRLIEISHIDLNNLQSKIWLKAGKNGGYLKIGPYIRINEDWVYVSELIKGDGHITPNFWYINFINKDKELISFVKNFFISLGLPPKRIYIYSRSDVDFLTVRSYPLAYLLHKLFLVPTGKKIEMDIADFVINNPLLSAAAVRGAFDAEGSVSFTGSRRICIASISKNWLTKISQILEKLKIKSRIYAYNEKRKYPIYRLHIYHIINLTKFQEVIKPLNRKRRDKLNIIIHNSNRNYDEVFRNKILAAINIGYIRKKDISRHLNLSLNIVGNNIYRLRKNKLIEPKSKIFTNKGCYFKYKLTLLGQKYLEDKSSLPFFD